MVTHQNARIPYFLKVLLYITLLLQKTYITTCFHEPEIQRGFNFYEERQKAKLTFSICFAASCCRGSMRLEQWSGESGPVGLLLQEPHSASPQQAAIASRCACEHCVSY